MRALVVGLLALAVAAGNAAAAEPPPPAAPYVPFNLGTHHPSV